METGAVCPSVSSPLSILFLYMSDAHVFERFLAARGRDAYSTEAETAERWSKLRAARRLGPAIARPLEHVLHYRISKGLLDRGGDAVLQAYAASADRHRRFTQVGLRRLRHTYLVNTIFTIDADPREIVDTPLGVLPGLVAPGETTTHAPSDAELERILLEHDAGERRTEDAELLRRFFTPLIDDETDLTRQRYVHNTLIDDTVRETSLKRVLAELARYTKVPRTDPAYTEAPIANLRVTDPPDNPFTELYPLALRREYETAAKQAAIEWKYWEKTNETHLDRNTWTADQWTRGFDVSPFPALRALARRGSWVGMFHYMRMVYKAHEISFSVDAEAEVREVFGICSGHDFKIDTGTDLAWGWYSSMGYVTSDMVSEVKRKRYGVSEGLVELVGTTRAYRPKSDYARLEDYSFKTGALEGDVSKQRKSVANREAFERGLPGVGAVAHSSWMVWTTASAIPSILAVFGTALAVNQLVNVAAAYAGWDIEYTKLTLFAIADAGTLLQAGLRGMGWNPYGLFVRVSQEDAVARVVPEFGRASKLGESETTLKYEREKGTVDFEVGGMAEHSPVNPEVLIRLFDDLKDESRAILGKVLYSPAMRTPMDKDNALKTLIRELYPDVKDGPDRTDYAVRVAAAHDAVVTAETNKGTTGILPLTRWLLKHTPHTATAAIDARTFAAGKLPLHPTINTTNMTKIGPDEFTALNVAQTGSRVDEAAAFAGALITIDLEGAPDESVRYTRALVATYAGLEAASPEGAIGKGETREVPKKKSYAQRLDELVFTQGRTFVQEIWGYAIHVAAFPEVNNLLPTLQQRAKWRKLSYLLYEGAAAMRWTDLLIQGDMLDTVQRVNWATPWKAGGIAVLLAGTGVYNTVLRFLTRKYAYYSRPDAKDGWFPVATSRFFLRGAIIALRTFGLCAAAALGAYRFLKGPLFYNLITYVASNFAATVGLIEAAVSNGTSAMNAAANTVAWFSSWYNGTEGVPPSMLRQFIDTTETTILILVLGTVGVRMLRWWKPAWAKALEQVLFWLPRKVGLARGVLFASSMNNDVFSETNGERPAWLREQRVMTEWEEPAAVEKRRTVKKKKATEALGRPAVQLSPPPALSAPPQFAYNGPLIEELVEGEEQERVEQLLHRRLVPIPANVDL